MKNVWKILVVLLAIGAVLAGASSALGYKIKPSSQVAELSLEEQKFAEEAGLDVAWRRKLTARANAYGLTITGEELVRAMRSPITGIKFFMVENPYQYKGKPMFVTGLLFDRIISDNEVVFKIGDMQVVGVTHNVSTYGRWYVNHLIVFRGMSQYRNALGGTVSIPTFYIIGP